MKKGVKTNRFRIKEKALFAKNKNHHFSYSSWPVNWRQWNEVRYHHRPADLLDFHKDLSVYWNEDTIKILFVCVICIDGRGRYVVETRPIPKLPIAGPASIKVYPISDWPASRKTSGQHRSRSLISLAILTVDMCFVQWITNSRALRVMDDMQIV